MTALSHLLDALRGLKPRLPGPPASSRDERALHRDQLYKVIRDALARAGWVSASYRFKVLSLDARGRRFLVMIDLAADVALPMERLGDLEERIEDAALARHDLQVKAVYWRVDPRLAAVAGRRPVPPPVRVSPPGEGPTSVPAVVPSRLAKAAIS